MRLRSRIATAGPDDCWLWQGAKRNNGYGHLSRGRRDEGYVAAHRAAWEIKYGDVPDGLCVLHRCDVPACCNPAHLFLGTLADNSRDMISKGRGRGMPPGELHPDARLSDAEVTQIRTLAAAGTTYADLARRFTISHQHARAIVLLRLKRAA